MKLMEYGRYYKEYCNEHDRLEVREYYVSNDIEWLEEKAEWKGLSGMGLCISKVTEGEKQPKAEVMEFTAEKE